MPNTGVRRENKRYANAKEVETVQDAKKLVSKTTQRAAKLSNEEQAREHRHEVNAGKKARDTTTPPTEEQAAERMVDEGDPNTGKK